MLTTDSQWTSLRRTSLWPGVCPELGLGPTWSWESGPRLPSDTLTPLPLASETQGRASQQHPKQCPSQGCLGQAPPWPLGEGEGAGGAGTGGRPAGGGRPPPESGIWLFPGTLCRARNGLSSGTKGPLNTPTSSSAVRGPALTSPRHTRIHTHARHALTPALRRLAAPRRVLREWAALGHPLQPERCYCAVYKLGVPRAAPLPDPSNPRVTFREEETPARKGKGLPVNLPTSPSPRVPHHESRPRHPRVGGRSQAPTLGPTQGPKVRPRISNGGECPCVVRWDDSPGGVNTPVLVCWYWRMYGRRGAEPALFSNHPGHRTGRMVRTLE